MRGNKSESERKEEAPTDTKSSTERPPPSIRRQVSHGLQLPSI